ncbi:Membrane protein involved in the export of O-antigen and teichoic acid [Salinibacillus kushneri]|uniref:Membrane protein involved in the export of O-antigen and teichoic acid n=1 Tax=Salinibacillus kushneri TaxID=237682 RepID=A0A1I0JHL8_9BACI|nr:flippase [Salinibacillus kushneri]SEU09511.1 Membrane protein involved in the export of O-antigen and teichoic acid [Salinibacillus kushneri]
MQKELANVTKQSSIVFSGKIIGLSFGLLFNFIAARFLGAEIYGQFMYIFTFISLLPPLVIMGLQKGLVYFIPQLQEDQQLVRRNSYITLSFLLVFLTSSIVAISIIINSDFISNILLNNPELNTLVKLMAPLIIFLALNDLLKGVFQGVNKIKFFVLNESIIIPVLKVVVLLGVYLLGFVMNSIVLAFYVATVTGFIYLIILVIRLRVFSRIRFSNFKDFKKIFKYSLPLLFSGYLMLISQKTDIMMIGYFSTDGQVGIYNIALRVGTLSSFILVAFNTMFAPTISSLFHRGKLETLENMYKVITKWIVGVNLIAFALIFLLNEEIMHVFGSEYVAGSIALVLVSVGQVVNAGVGSAGMILSMTGKPVLDMITNFIVVIVNVSLNYTLIPIYGIEGAAIASMVSVGIANIIRLLLVYKMFRFHPYNFGFVKIICSIVIASLLIKCVLSFTEFLWYMNLILLPLLFIGIFMLVYYWLGMDKEDKDILNTMKRKMKIG